MDPHSHNATNDIKARACHFRADSKKKQKQRSILSRENPAVLLRGIADSVVKIATFYPVLGLRIVAIFLFL
jgi:hypothetical protein